ncbi:MAG: N-formylglutamate amidohydrolase [Bradyrhizobium sp.]|uniref:N-formylglutamate amidohydrolase n=1 Tax=Bradyrhizobium sp. TaxID=376 RepID=UPI003D14B44A
MAEAPVLLLSCEHAGNRIPPEYRPLFRNSRRLLAGHRAYDPGALACARALGRRLRAPLIAAAYSRLLIDLNRSPGHPALFSTRTRQLPSAEKQRLLARYYRPHRDRVEHWIRERIAAGTPVVHVAVHSFTPVLNGAARRVDIGLLYDPARPGEAALCRRWRAALRDAGGGDFAVRRNHPYRGVSDGLTRHLRTRFPAARYAGIELEINQKLLRRDAAARRRLAAVLAHTLREALQG